MKIDYKVLSISILMSLIFIIISCSDNDELTLGSDFVDYSTKFFQADTFSVELSTVIVDSLITSETGIALVGYFEDGNFGKISAKNFTQLNIPSVIDIDENDKFDSITIEIPYGGYYYGDTTIKQELSVYLLKERMESSDDNYYNSTEIEYDTDPIGKSEYFPHPGRDSIITFRIDNELGLDLFQKLKNEAEEVQTNTSFQEYIYGIAIVSNTESSSIVGFDQSEIVLKLYESNSYYVSEEDIDQDVYEFVSSGEQYNQIISDRSGTVLQSLSSQEEELNHNFTQNKTYIQGGAGVLTKVRFPYFNSLLFSTEDIIVSAELILKPDIVSYSGEFPDELNLYKTDQYNNFNINISDNIVSSSTFILDQQYHENTSYTFDVTDYIKSVINAGSIDNNYGLMVTIPSDNFSTTLDRLVISASEDVNLKPKLKIVYLVN